MKKLLSLPPNLVECFHDIEGVGRDEWFCTSDPVGFKLGSGGGTTWLLQECMRNEGYNGDVSGWLAAEKRILLHAGGQSRRLPSYAPSGKVLTPIPVFRWGRGQKLSQNLLDLQLPLYEKIMDMAPAGLNTLIASGDVYIRAKEALQPVPDADVVCYGLWVDPQLAKNHGVFVSDRKSPERLKYMLQKPSVETLGGLMQDHLFLMDIGIWLLSDRAVELMMKRSMCDDGKSLKFYDMYSEFGLCLGDCPRIEDSEINGLSVAILPLPGGEFHHYGTSREMISSTLAVQNSVIDQRMIMHKNVKPHESIFVQNAKIDIRFESCNHNVWVENSHLAENWEISSDNIITGVPENNWCVSLREGVCLDIVPVYVNGASGDKSETMYVARPYGFNDAFKGRLDDAGTMFMGRPFMDWLNERGLLLSEIEGSDGKEGVADIQSARIFPAVKDIKDLGLLVNWMINQPKSQYVNEGLTSDDIDLNAEDAARMLWRKVKRFSADEISAYANLRALYAQREAFRKENYTALAKNHEKSVFYQLDLLDAAEDFSKLGLELPELLNESAPLLTRMSDMMFRSKKTEFDCGNPALVDKAEVNRSLAAEYQDKAFGMMRKGLMGIADNRQRPVLSVYSDQIVWGRSPVRIDLAGGWTDTPPYSLMEGGNVVNLAIELNGQPPLQVYVKPCSEYKVVLRSIDLGAMEVVSTFEEIYSFNKVGSPFSIPKAALVLAGFHPEFSIEKYDSLEEQLKAFGCGIEVTLLSAIPAGSGLGTSSILASTVLGAVNDFCGLNWDKHEIGMRTLVLEQLLTTGGGWQDQYGGVLQGIKLLQTESGWNQVPKVRWLPDYLFTDTEYKRCHLLYYTGITRTAKNILSEIVKGMFLNSSKHLSLLGDMKEHAVAMYDAIQRSNFEEMGRLVRKTWKQNMLLDAGTNPPAVAAITGLIDDLCLGYKLPGAGGGGYLYMVAKDEEAAARIRKILTENAPNDRARFVEMSLSAKGLEVSRS